MGAGDVRVVPRLLGGSERELRVPVQPPAQLAPHVLGRIEVGNLRRNLRAEGGCVEACDPANRTPSGRDPPPQPLFPVANGRDGADASDHHPAPLAPSPLWLP